MNFLKRYKIKTKFMGTVIMVLLLFTVALGVYRNALNSTEGGFGRVIDQELQVTILAKDIDSLMLQSRRSEKDFILRKDMKYLPRVQKNVETMVAESEEIAKIASALGEDELVDISQSIASHAKEYQEAFEQVVQSNQRRGLDQNSGLRADFRKAAHQFTVQVAEHNLDDLLVSLLQLRRYEKDYLRTKSAKYKKKFSAALAEYSALLEKSQCDPIAKKAQEKALATYQKAARNFLAGTSVDKNYQIMRAAAGDMEDAIESVHVEAAPTLALEIRKQEKDYMLRGNEKYVKKTIGAVANLHAAFVNSDTLSEHVTSIKTDLDQYQQSFKALVAEDKKITALVAEMRAAVHVVEPEVEKIVELAGKMASARVETIKTTAASSSRNAVVISLMALFTGLAVSYLISNAISRPLQDAVGKVGRIADGDFSVEIEVDSKDEIGMMLESMKEMVASLTAKAKIADIIAQGDLSQEVVLASDVDDLGKSLREMSDNLNQIIGEVLVATEQIASGSGQVADASQSLSQGAAEQAASLEQITSSMTEMASQTKTNAENAGQANNLAEETRNAAQRGHEQMQDMVTAMGEISESGQSISKIIKTIDEIAFQTNLLALNAAVEAARAGRHGKGFAVVAEEVRNLAARSAKAAKETAELIEGSVDKTNNGSEIANRTAGALDEIVSSVGKVSDLVAEIAAASNEQAEGISQVNIGITQIDQVTQQNTANAEEGASAAEELSSQAEHLKQMMARFRIREQAYGGGQPQLTSFAAQEDYGQEQPQLSAPSMPAKTVKPADVIDLDDQEFGKF